MTLAVPLHITRDGYIEILQREAIVLVPYPDGKFGPGPRQGEPKHSQGVGSQTNWDADPPREVRADDKAITVERAVVWLKKSVEEREQTINRLLEVEITRHQFTAIHSLFYQSGSDEMREVVGLFNKGKPYLAICAFAKFTKDSKGEDSEGLAYRRAGEIAIGAFGYYDDQTRIPVYDSLPSHRRPDYWIDASTLEL